MPRKKLPSQQVAAEVAEIERKNRCAYCDKPTRKGSLVLDEGQTAHRSCYREFEGS